MPFLQHTRLVQTNVAPEGGAEGGGEGGGGEGGGEGGGAIAEKPPTHPT